MYGVSMKKENCEPCGENQVIQICGSSGESESSFLLIIPPFIMFGGSSPGIFLSSDP